MSTTLKMWKVLRWNDRNLKRHDVNAYTLVVISKDSRSKILSLCIMPSVKYKYLIFKMMWKFITPWLLFCPIFAESLRGFQRNHWEPIMHLPLSESGYGSKVLILRLPAIPLLAQELKSYRISGEAVLEAVKSGGLVKHLRSKMVLAHF